MNNVLIISNNKLALSDANGRTLLNLLHALKGKYNFFQFSINNNLENNNLIIENFVLSDHEVLNGIKKMKFNLGKINEVENKSASGNKKIKKTALTMLIRYRLWCLNLKFNKKLYNWVKTSTFTTNNDTVETYTVIKGDTLFMGNNE